MKRFQKGDRVFDIRYGWGIVNEGFTAGTISVYFKDIEVTMFYDKRFFDRILSYTEYTLDGQSLDRPELTWWSVNKEWIDSKKTQYFVDFLDENFEPPVRKCK